RQEGVLRASGRRAVRQDLRGRGEGQQGRGQAAQGAPEEVRTSGRRIQRGGRQGLQGSGQQAAVRQVQAARRGPLLLRVRARCPQARGRDAGRLSSPHSGVPHQQVH